MKNIPIILIYSRIVIALLIGFIAFQKVENFATYIVILMIVGLLTDVFDGIIARHLNISTKKLRILDSNADQFFWIITIASIFYLNFSFVKEHIIAISSILILELLAYLISLIKFKKTIATHSLLAKFWTITLLLFLIDLTLREKSGLLFFTCVIIGIISRLEIILIIIGLKKWTTDVPSILAVKKINNGEPIKKNKLFNS